ncbi:carbohydrate ABC transporter permease [Frondihabitans australicus]|uniref:Carbohydrate ABC transporter membrane protein 2 (CUT1 family) n=1 Tax=Frondihabitans australicus TaxID=386892 RepID=A0A495IDB9_9MICO|nr:carbohydrate ABC transporter permease [Frondihabitans australicus]RKR73105.1 carbohydrate ABC transporter membrane protein 2 (CUT1 family) [Frondihabitans australicus]
MSTLSVRRARVGDTAKGSVTARRRRTQTEQRKRGGWWRFTLILIVTAVVLVPIVAVVGLSFQPGLGSTANGFTFENYSLIFSQTAVLTWLQNSLTVTVVTVVIAVAVAAPAGYVLSRARNKLVSGYSLVLFVVQSLPVVSAVIPLFILFSKLGLVDNLVGVTIIYVGSTMSVAIWMMAAYYDSIPIALEEAAWMDGASLFGSFTRIVLRNSLPGILSTAIFSFLLAWNDYLIALVFLRSDPNYTLPVGLETFFQQNATNWGLVMAVAVVMMLPPIILFAFLNKYFSVGGIGGSLAGR